MSRLGVCKPSHYLLHYITFLSVCFAKSFRLCGVTARHSEGQTELLRDRRQARQENDIIT